MKIIASILLAGNFAIAQTEPTPEEIQKLIQLNQVTAEVAQELAQDPRIEVTETQDGYQVKARTEPTIDPVDPEEKFQVDNIQGLFNFSFGRGKTFTPGSNLSKFASGTNPRPLDRSSNFEIEMGVRAPVKGLKRLILGFGLGFEGAGQFSNYGDSNTIARAGDQEINEWFFANVDVLYLRKARAVLSTGYHYGSYTVLELSPTNLQQTYDKEHAGTLRWQQMIYSSKDKRNSNDTGSEGVAYYAQVRRAKNGTTALNFGLTLMYGSDWPWLKRTKTK